MKQGTFDRQLSQFAASLAAIFWLRKKRLTKTQGSEFVNSEGPGFAVLYRWRLHEGAEESFVKAWTRVSELLLSERGSLGSRLHRGPDGLWYSYAQWPSAESREQAFALEPVDPEAGRRMAEAIAEVFPEIILESVSDLMVLPAKNGA